MLEAQVHRPVQILMVEDSPDDAELMTEALQDGSWSIEVRLVEDGEEAMQYLRGEGAYQSAPRPDLVLLDLQLPKRNGHEVLSDIKEDPSLRRIPVVILTSSRDDFDYNRAYDLFANCCVAKPIDPKQFVQAVEQIELFWLTSASMLRPRPGNTPADPDDP